MAKAKISKTEYEGLHEELQKEYTEKDGGFVLNVISVDGLALEDITGLKSTVEKLRQAEKDLTASVKATQQSLEAEKAKFAGIDPAQARDLATKVEDIQNWDGETKVAEAVKAAETKHQQMLEELNTKHKTTVDELQNMNKNMEEQLRDAIVTTKITSAIAAEGGNVPLLIPHVKTRVNMVKDSSGKFIPEVTHENGTPRIGDNEGNPMTIDQFIAEMKTKDVFASAFKGVNSTGSGNTGNEGGKETNNDTTKVIKASDETAKSKNLENIAAGKTTVQMD